MERVRAAASPGPLTAAAGPERRQLETAHTRARQRSAGLRGARETAGDVRQVQK